MYDELGPPWFGLRPGRVAAWLARHVEVGAAKADLTLAQYRLLVLLELEGSAPSALAERLAVSRPSVTSVVDGLVARGLVSRSHDADDRRRITHELTAAGRSLLAAADEAVETRLRAILEHLGDEARCACAVEGLSAWTEAMMAQRAAHLAVPAEPAAQVLGGAS